MIEGQESIPNISFINPQRGIESFWVTIIIITVLFSSLRNEITGLIAVSRTLKI